MAANQTTQIYNQYGPKFRSDGSVIDSAQVAAGAPGGGTASPLLIRAVVVSVTPYLANDSTYPGIRCNCFAYSTNPTACGPVWDVAVAYPHSSHQGGDVMLPRACTRQMTQIAKGISEGNLEPAELDGDHVLIGFYDGYIDGCAVIVAYLPHPKVDEGKAPVQPATIGSSEPLGPSPDPLGYRVRPGIHEGRPAFRKHLGAWAGIDSYGSYEINTTRAHLGDEAYAPDLVASRRPVPSAGEVADNGGGYDAEGVEVPNTGVQITGTSRTGLGRALAGSVRVRLQDKAEFMVEYPGSSWVPADGEQEYGARILLKWPYAQSEMELLADQVFIGSPLPPGGGANQSNREENVIQGRAWGEQRADLNMYVREALANVNAQLGGVPNTLYPATNPIPANRNPAGLLNTISATIPASQLSPGAAAMPPVVANPNLTNVETVLATLQPMLTLAQTALLTPPVPPVTPMMVNATAIGSLMSIVDQLIAQVSAQNAALKDFFLTYCQSTWVRHYALQTFEAGSQNGQPNIDDDSRVVTDPSISEGNAYLSSTVYTKDPYIPPAP